MKDTHALFVDTAITADDGIVSVGDGHLHIRLVGIEDDDDVAPVVSAGIILQAISHNPLGGIDELQVLAYKVGITQTEGGMMLSEGDEILVIRKDLRILRLVGPIQLVNAVWRFETVVHTFLIAQQFFTTKHEGHTL